MRPVRLEPLYKDRRNRVTASLVTRKNGVETPVTWSAVTRMVLVILATTPVVVDTDDNEFAIDYTLDGEVSFDIGEVAAVKALPAGDYYVRLTAFDETSRDTELMSDGSSKPVILPIRDTSTLP